MTAEKMEKAVRFIKIQLGREPSVKDVRLTLM